MDPEIMTPSTIIYSPRSIANGQGRWIGTVGEALTAAADVDLGNLETRLYEGGAFSSSDLDRGFDVTTHAHLLSLDHLRALLDDPNADVVDLTVYSTHSEAVDREVTAPLGDRVEDFNVAAIADEVIHEIGRHRFDAFGYVAYPMDRDFWQVAADYDETDL